MGTTMCIYLPRHHGEASAEGAAPLPDADAEGRGVVLVVDDEANVRAVVVEVMADMGHATLEAEDGARALDILRTGVRVDLLITDVGLPGGMNGRQLADAGRLLRKNLKVLFITGYAENAVVGNGHLEPGMQILTKPFEIDALASRANDLMSAH